MDIRDNETNLEISIAFLLANLKGFYMIADGPLTVKTNNPGPDPAPDDTIILAADQPVHYLDGATPAETCPITEDVATIFVTSGNDPVHLDIRVLSDAEV
jgi:hypothetical protein